MPHVRRHHLVKRLVIPAPQCRGDVESIDDVIRSQLVLDSKILELRADLRRGLDLLYLRAQFTPLPQEPVDLPASLRRELFRGLLVFALIISLLSLLFCLFLSFGIFIGSSRFRLLRFLRALDGVAVLGRGLRHLQNGIQHRLLGRLRRARVRGRRGRLDGRIGRSSALGRGGVGEIFVVLHSRSPFVGRHSRQQRGP